MVVKSYVAMCVRILVLSVLFLLSAGNAHSQDLRQGLTLDSFAAELSKAVKTLQADIAIGEQMCGPPQDGLCIYTLAGEIRLLVKADGGSKTLRQVILVRHHSPDISNFALSARVLIAVVDPSASADQRTGIVQAALLEATSNSSGDSEFKFNGIRYSATVDEDVGMWFVARRD